MTAGQNKLICIPRLFFPFINLHIIYVLVLNFEQDSSASSHIFTPTSIKILFIQETFNDIITVKMTHKCQKLHLK